MSTLGNSALNLINRNKLFLSVYHLYRSAIGYPVLSSAVNHQKKIVFVHNPKVAGTSLRKLLGLEGEISHLTPGLLVPKKIWEEYAVIVAIREPIERLISSYNYHTGSRYNGYYLHRYPDIKQWTVEKYFDIFSREPFGIIPQINYLVHPLSEKKPDFIIRYENLNQDVKRLMRNLKFSQSELPVLNDSAYRKDQMKFISKGKFLDRLIRFYREDYNELGYPLPA